MGPVWQRGTGGIRNIHAPAMKRPVRNKAVHQIRGYPHGAVWRDSPPAFRRTEHGKPAERANQLATPMLVERGLAYGLLPHGADNQKGLLLVQVIR